MNVLLLAIAFRAWRGAPLSIFLRIMAAIAAFSIEVQVATWLHAATIPSLRLLNLGIAALSIASLARSRSQTAAADDADVIAWGRGPALGARAVRLPPPAAVVASAVLILALALLLPVTPADPYHLHRVDQITRLGTLAYDPAVLDIKVNALAGVYELLLADLRIPGMASALVRLHGLLGLTMYLLTIAVAVQWIPITRRWLLLVFLVVPVVFHQQVLVKNDLFGALPAFVATAWIVSRGRAMAVWEVASAAALAGFAVGIKISSAPVALVVGLFVVVDHRSWRAVGAAVVAGAAGAVAGGLLFTLMANHLVYGGAMQPYLSLSNRHESLDESVRGVGRFAISLFDLGLVTPSLWPGRGGWGSTFGLPLIWAFVVLGTRLREVLVTRALWATLPGFAAFAANYPDADIAHRMVIAPALLLIMVAIRCVDAEDSQARWLRRGLVPVLALSALQIARSSMLYLR